MLTYHQRGSKGQFKFLIKWWPFDGYNCILTTWIWTKLTKLCRCHFHNRFPDAQIWYQRSKIPLPAQVMTLCYDTEWCPLLATMHSLVPGGCINMIIQQMIFASISCAFSVKSYWNGYQNYKSTLVHVMVWFRQATSHYMKQSWPIFLPPYNITGGQWVRDDVI